MAHSRGANSPTARSHGCSLGNRQPGKRPSSSRIVRTVTATQPDRDQRSQEAAMEETSRLLQDNYKEEE